MKTGGATEKPECMKYGLGNARNYTM